ncbi:MAG: putative metal-binding motif-containing protein [Myxococcota bacterium]
MIQLLLACGAGGPDTASLGEGRATAPESPDPHDTSDTSAPPGDTAPDTGPFDRDADGVTPGDGDCDDANANVRPGAEDLCDALDQDCDGVAQPEASCGQRVPLELGATGWWEGQSQVGMLSLMEADTDYTADGVIDIVAGSNCVFFEGDWRCNGNVLLLPGEPPAGGIRWTETSAAWWVADPSTDYPRDFGNAGDFDGDGATDLFIAAAGCWPDDGSLYVMLGPWDRWPRDGAWMADAADGWWQQAEPWDCFAEDVSGGHDLDGDGLDDLLVVTGGNWEREWEEHALTFVPGRSPVPGPLPILEELWFSGDQMQDFAALPDMDGDGVGEAAVTLSHADVPYTLGFVPTDVLTADAASFGEPIADVVERATFREQTPFGFLEGRHELGDTDGDGYQEVAIRIARDVTADGVYDLCVASLHGGPDLRSSPADERVQGMICNDGSLSGVGEHTKVGGDADGDGIPDIVYGPPFEPAASYVACILPSSRAPEAGWLMFDELPAYCYGIGENDGIRGGLADLDGDGLPEILGSEPYWQRGADEYVGRILVAPGFEIPWGDSTRW